MNAQLRAATPHDAPANAPDWLADELSANKTFVREALENDGALTTDAAAAWTAGEPWLVASLIDAAVSAWIAHQWEFHNADAVLISNVWQSFDRESAK